MRDTTTMECAMATRTDKPWGYELLWSHTDHYAGKVIHINAGRRLSLQYHEQKNESVLVLSGTLMLHLGQGEDSRIIELSPGESHDIPVGGIHRFEAPPDTDVEIIEVSTPELDDVVRLEDDYNRADPTP
jgi:mannose-6-phosphate isomerase